MHSGLPYSQLMILSFQSLPSFQRNNPEGLSASPPIQRYPLSDSSRRNTTSEMEWIEGWKPPIFWHIFLESVKFIPFERLKKYNCWRLLLTNLPSALHSNMKGITMTVKTNDNFIWMRDSDSSRGISHNEQIFHCISHSYSSRSRRQHLISREPQMTKVLESTAPKKEGASSKINNL